VITLCKSIGWTRSFWCGAEPQIANGEGLGSKLTPLQRQLLLSHTILSASFDTTPSRADMDITNFVVSSRDAALLYGDYGTYRRQLSRRLLSYRKKLQVVTKNRGKFQPAKLTADQSFDNPECVHAIPRCPLLQSL